MRFNTFSYHITMTQILTSRYSSAILLPCQLIGVWTFNLHLKFLVSTALCIWLWLLCRWLQAGSQTSRPFWVLRLSSRRLASHAKLVPSASYPSVPAVSPCKYRLEQTPTGPHLKCLPNLIVNHQRLLFECERACVNRAQACLIGLL